MSWLTISGIDFPTAEASQGTSRHEFDRGLTGRGRVMPGSTSNRQGRSRALSTRPVPTDEARFWFQLFQRRGNVWSFETNDDVSSNGVPTVTAVTPASDNPKWGTYHLDRTTTDITVADGLTADNFTVIYWYDDGGGYEHVVSTRLPGDVADRIWVDGVRNDSYTQPHALTSGALVLDTNGDFDDIVVLPFGMPTTLASQPLRTGPFSSLPRLDMRGDGMPHRVVELVGQPVLTAQNLGSEIRWSSSATFETYERAGAV